MPDDVLAKIDEQVKKNNVIVYIDHRVFVWVISGHFRGQAACT